MTTAPPTSNVPSRPCPMAQARAVIGGTPVRLGRRVSTVNPLLTRWASHRTARSTVRAIRVRHTGSTGRAAAATLQGRSLGCAIRTCLALSRARLTTVPGRSDMSDEYNSQACVQRWCSRRGIEARQGVDGEASTCGAGSAASDCGAAMRRLAAVRAARRVARCGRWASSGDAWDRTSDVAACVRGA